jgi:hypothetical protein
MRTTSILFGNITNQLSIKDADSIVKDLRSWMIFALLCALSIGAALWLQSGTSAGPLPALQTLAEDIQGLFATSPEPEDIDAQIPANPLESKNFASSSQFPAPQSNSGAVASDHTANDQQVCNRPRTQFRNEAGTNPVYQWVDGEGQTHLSDTPPSDHIASVIDMATGTKRDFTYEISADGITLPITFQGQISAGSKRIYDTWHFFLGDTDLRQSQIKLRVIGGPDRYDAFQRKAWPNSKPTNGFYINSKNQAYVKYDPNRPEQSLHTSFHEISHLITASHLGPTPPWLTEGLAEYFENMEVTGQGGTIHPNKAHLTLLKKSPLPRLHDFLEIDRSQWNGAQRDLNYATAWSLMHFLMQGAPGMYAMQDVVQQAHASFCKPFSVSTALHNAYPGGLKRLESDWKKWLHNNRASVQQT